MHQPFDSYKQAVENLPIVCVDVICKRSDGKVLLFYRMVDGGGRWGMREDEEPMQVCRELCEQWVDHPVLVRQRDTFANFFHDR
jgi:hypothetical protein